MEITVVVEQLADGRFEAAGAEPFGVKVVGDTEDDALAKLRASLEQRLDAGARVVTLRLGEPNRPWRNYAGMFQADDPVVREWHAIMQQQRDNEAF